MLYIPNDKELFTFFQLPKKGMSPFLIGLIPHYVAKCGMHYSQSPYAEKGSI